MDVKNLKWAVVQLAWSMRRREHSFLQGAVNIAKAKSDTYTPESYGRYERRQ